MSKKLQNVQARVDTPPTDTVSSEMELHIGGPWLSPIFDGVFLFVTKICTRF